MKQVHYYPGCTLKTTGLSFDRSAREAMAVLGFEMVELPSWNCCGTVYSLTSDDLIHHLAPVRNLVRARDLEAETLTTLCSMCFNTLKRADILIRNDPEKRKKINNFMEEESDYNGEVAILHLLEILRDDVGYENLSERTGRKLASLRLAPYSGCMLLRPKEVAIDDPENPRIFSDFIASTGARAVDFPFHNECCGSYQTVTNRSIIQSRTSSIIGSARSSGADAIVTSCPLCHYNLESGQRDLKEKQTDFKLMPVFYFTQILCLALGLDRETCRFDLHIIDPLPLLEEKGLYFEG